VSRRREVVLAGHRGDVEVARAALVDAEADVRVLALGACARLGVLSDDDVRSAADPSDLLGHLIELRLRACRDHHVRTGFGERQCHRGAESAARSGHHRDLIVELEPVENHVFLASLAGRHGNKGNDAV
jgi:hypothetical protein